MLTNDEFYTCILACGWTGFKITKRLTSMSLQWVDPDRPQNYIQIISFYSNGISYVDYLYHIDSKNLIEVRDRPLPDLSSSSLRFISFLNDTVEYYYRLVRAIENEWTLKNDTIVKKYNEEKEEYEITLNFKASSINDMNQTIKFIKLVRLNRSLIYVNSLPNKVNNQLTEDIKFIYARK